jgi:hypothetical protein
MIALSVEMSTKVPDPRGHGGVGQVVGARTLVASASWG